MNDARPFFHDHDFATIQSEHPNMTWPELNEKYRQPEWCGEPDPINPMGCWGLAWGEIKRPADCGDCPSRITPNDPAERTR